MPTTTPCKLQAFSYCLNKVDVSQTTPVSANLDKNCLLVQKAVPCYIPQNSRTIWNRFSKGYEIPEIHYTGSVSTDLQGMLLASYPGPGVYIYTASMLFQMSNTVCVQQSVTIVTMVKKLLLIIHGSISEYGIHLSWFFPLYAM